MINIGLITTKQARRQPNAWAVFDNTSQRRVTFKELDDLVKKIANGLLSLGLKKGDRVSILSQNSIEFLALFFACGQAGLVAHALNWRLAKTEIAKIMGEIFSNLGILKKKKFKKVTRSDLIAGYLGQTALKTTEVIKESLGGVLFIDEVYQLGNAEGRDSYSKECIDTINQNLTERQGKFICIIAGYKDSVENCFFP